MIKIICIGKVKEKYLQDAINDYIKRIKKYIKLEIIELEEDKSDDLKISLIHDKKKILSNITSKDNLIILDIKGEEKTSEDFAKMINNELTYNSNITFIIGSSYGISNEIKQLTSKKISFSKLTFPHQLFRLLLLEQTYRAFKILNNESYHK